MSLKLKSKVVNKDVLKKPKVEIKLKKPVAYHNVFFKEGRSDEK